MVAAVPDYWFVLGHSGQQTSVKCVEATWNYKSGGVVHLKPPAYFFLLSLFNCNFCFDLGVFGESSCEEDHIKWTRHNCFLLYQCGVFSTFVELLSMEAE